MAKQLPLNALRVFEAAARCLSFRQAAEELHITPSAVSQQIRTLEELLDVQLFGRTGRSLTLTPAGAVGLAKLREGFANLAEAVRQIEAQKQPSSLAVWAAPSFASKWLMPRLPRFSAAHPGIDLTLSATSELIDRTAGSHGPAGDAASADLFRRHPVDLAVRFGRGKYPGCRVDRLFPVTAVPLCSPRLLEGERPLRCPADLAHHTLLHDDTEYEGQPEWSWWLRAAGVEGVDTTHGLHFNSVALALDAAVDGQGVVLSLEPLAADDLAAGNLVVPFEPRLELEHAYHLLSLAGVEERSAVTRFREWLLAEAAAQRDAVSAGVCSSSPSVTS